MQRRMGLFEYVSDRAQTQTPSDSQKKKKTEEEIARETTAEVELWQ